MCRARFGFGRLRHRLRPVLSFRLDDGLRWLFLLGVRRRLRRELPGSLFCIPRGGACGLPRLRNWLPTPRRRIRLICCVGGSCVGLRRIGRCRRLRGIRRATQVFDGPLQFPHPRAQLALVFDGPFERVHPGAHLVRLNVSPEQVADGGPDRQAHRSSRKADQRAEDGERSRNHRTSYRGPMPASVPAAALEPGCPAPLSLPSRAGQAPRAKPAPASAMTSRTVIASQD